MARFPYIRGQGHAARQAARLSVCGDYGPDIITPSQWMPEALGEAPEYESLEQAKEFMGAEKLSLSRSPLPIYHSNHHRWKPRKLGIGCVDRSTHKQRAGREIGKKIGEITQKPGK
jgi:hypothetical protein